MHTRLVKLPIQDYKAPDNAVLTPLLHGRTVTLAVRDSKMRLKARAPTTLLLIAPLSVYGSDSTGLLLSFPGYGCEVVQPPKVTSAELFRLGLSMHAAKILAANINQLFQQQPGGNHGNP